MTRLELDALRTEYLTMVPADFIRGAFISKETLRALLNNKRDASGLFFYLIPDKSGSGAKFTIYAEPLDANKQRYPENVLSQYDTTDRDLDAPSFAEVCPPEKNCP